MEVRSEYADGTLYIRLIGELDHHAAEGTLRRMEQEADRYLPVRCAVDLSGLTFMDSSGIAVFLRMKKRMRETDGEVLLIDPRTQPAHVISASGLGKMIPVKRRERRRKNEVR